MAVNGELENDIRIGVSQSAKIIDFSLVVLKTELSTVISTSCIGDSRTIDRFVDLESEIISQWLIAELDIVRAVRQCSCYSIIELYGSVSIYLYFIDRVIKFKTLTCFSFLEVVSLSVRSRILGGRVAGSINSERS